MIDLFDDDGPETAPAGSANEPEYTVAELSGAVKRTVEDAFGRVRVRGELGRVSRPRSGHLYVDLKDADGRHVLASVCWKGTVARLGMDPQEGDEVVASGRLTTFPGQSRYQLVIERMELAGEGALLAKLERLKAALGAEGLFAPERKRPLPYLPEVVGVITSPSGAVIRDILHRLADRFPRRVLVWPVAVQGAACAPQVAAAIRGFDALPVGGPVPRPDVLIVARGGGSVEDLWGFNEEEVVRAVAACSIPVISAVGHETDTTLIDFAADLRAPTPTAAAEHAVPVRVELVRRLAGLEDRRIRAVARGLQDRARRLRDLARGLPRADAVLAEPAQRLDALGDRLPRALRALALARRAELARGPAGRFGPALVTGGVARRRDRLGDRAGRLAPALARATTLARRGLAALAARHRPDRAASATREGRRTLAALAPRLARAGGRAPADARARLSRAEAVLEAYSYRATLARGFAVVRGPDGTPATSAAALPAGAAAEIEFVDGRLPAVVGEASGHDPSKPAASRPSGPKPPRRASGGDGGGQGSLF